MTCRDCKNYQCKHPTFIAEAEWCDEYIPKHRDKRVRWNEYRIVQSGYNLHTVVLVDNLIIFHTQTTKPLTRLELYKMLRRVVKEKK